ncbi:hypothetical protein [Levilactobacillus andaensis]|uniref:hypothetical protein n=1 Tax=Levilactobacillus andaensis TaxID=2799570 RepID=UPI0019422A69|nr:hypothetical protein [Levilactobacillus andaensis]
MKLIKLVSAAMVATTMGAAAIVATPELTADAKAQKSLKTYPKALRRTWYHYEKNDNGKFTYSKLTFTATKLTDTWAGWGTTKSRTFKSVLHQYDPAKKLQKGKDNWAVAYKSGKSTRMGAWDTSKRFFMGPKRALRSYKVVTTKVDGKKVKVLHAKNLDSLPVDEPYYYTSKKLTKQTNPKGDNYGNDYGWN